MSTATKQPLDRNESPKELNPDRVQNAELPPGAAATEAAPFIPVISDETLLANYRLGDRSSFAQLMERYQRELFHFLIRFLGDRAAAEDVFQETFLQVHQSDLMRSQARRPTSPLQASISHGDDSSGQFIDLMSTTVEMPDEPLERAEIQAKVRQAVMNLPENLREILLLSYFHQFPYKQISDILNIPLGTVKSRLHAAVAQFADRWKHSNKGTTTS
jgi:RNA polymerase sigma-70 factor (ECF subfamily)